MVTARRAGNDRIAALHILGRWYRAAALVLLNTLVLLVLVDAVLAAFFWIRDAYESEPVAAKHVADPAYTTLYPGYRLDDIVELWKESVPPLVYEPFVEFREVARRGRYVNVAEAGFRLVKEQCPWPPEAGTYAIFAFGGSTTFGYGVADEDTWPSRLQEELSRGDRRNRVCVYNFGQGNYYSSQERVLFERLLESAHVPAMAIFMDGLNDFCFTKDDTASSERFTRALQGRESVVAIPWLDATLSRLALGRALQAVRKRLARAPETASERDDDPVAIRHVIARYLANKRLVEGLARTFGIVPVFVWQPVPSYKYDLAHHPFAAGGFYSYTRSVYGYPAMAEVVRSDPPDGNFVWLADIQEELHEPLYVDVAHYSPKFNAYLASELARRLPAHAVDRGP